jgi:hypothetical protein
MPAHRAGALAAAALLLAAPLAAQVSMTPRALGMGNAYVAAARGQEALWQNPANRGLPNTTHWSFGIPTLAVGADLLGLGVNDLRDVIDYQDQTDARKQELLDLIPASGTDFRGDLRAPLVAAQVRHLALGLSYNTMGNHTLDRDFVDLLLFGFQPQAGRYNITPAETQGFRAAYWDLAAGYGRRITAPLPGPLSVGATVHYFRGQGLIRSGITQVDTTRNALGIPTDIRVTYSGVRDEGGSGFGLDLGAAYQPMPGLTLSASLSNVMNSFEWGGDRRLKTVTLTSSDYRSGDIQDALDRYDTSETAYNDATASVRQRALAADLTDEVELPRTLRVGAALQPRTGTLLSAAYQSDLNTTRVRGVWDQSLGVGVQQQLAFLSARVGVSSNLDSGMLLSGGLSLGPLHLGVGRLSDGSVAGTDRDGWVATFGFGTSSGSRMP